jgi:hypothetical protein
MLGGRGLWRPRPKLGCSAVEEDKYSVPSIILVQIILFADYAQSYIANY